MDFDKNDNVSKNFAAKCQIEMTPSERQNSFNRIA